MPGEKCPDSCPAHSGIVEKQDNTEKWIEKIMTNHLPHIQTELESVKDELVSNKNWLIGILVSIISLLGAMVLNLLL